MTAPVDHVDQIMMIMEAAFDPQFGEAWSRRQVEDGLTLDSYSYSFIGASGCLEPQAEMPVGFALSRFGIDEEELLLFAVMPAYRGRGLGAALLQHFCQAASERGAKRIFLEMRKGNPAESVYLKAGFSVISIRPKYYLCSDGSRIDAISFARASVSERTVF